MIYEWHDDNMYERAGSIRAFWTKDDSRTTLAFERMQKRNKDPMGVAAIKVFTSSVPARAGTE